MNMIKVLKKDALSITTGTNMLRAAAFNGGYWDQCKEVGEKIHCDFPNDRYIVSPFCFMRWNG